MIHQNFGGQMSKSRVAKECNVATSCSLRGGRRRCPIARAAGHGRHRHGRWRLACSSLGSVGVRAAGSGDNMENEKYSQDSQAGHIFVQGCMEKVGGGRGPVEQPGVVLCQQLGMTPGGTPPKIEPSNAISKKKFRPFVPKPTPGPPRPRRGGVWLQGFF